MYQRATQTLILAWSALLLTSCNLKIDSADNTVQRVLSWLPSNTETVIVSQGPFWMSSFELEEEKTADPNRVLSREQLEKYFQGLTLRLFNLNGYILQRSLDGRRVLLAVEGSRNFRPPTLLGLTRFDGCEIAVFAKGLSECEKAFIRESTGVALRQERIADIPVTVLEEKLESDLWTTYVAFPCDKVVVSATDRDYLQEVLTGIATRGARKAWYQELPEWRQVAQGASFWGFRHFGEHGSLQDPALPMRDARSIGLTFHFDSEKGKTAKIKYLSNNANILSVAQSLFRPVGGQMDPDWVRYRQTEPEVVEISCELINVTAFYTFFGRLLRAVGHAVYI